MEAGAFRQGTRRNDDKATYPFGGSVPLLPGLLDAILVSLVGLVVSRVVLRLRHLSPGNNPKLQSPKKSSNFKTIEQTKIASHTDFRRDRKQAPLAISQPRPSLQGLSLNALFLVKGQESETLMGLVPPQKSPGG